MDQRNKMKRIVIIGTSGCGKTTLAKKLSKILNITCYDLDDYYWLPNWQPQSDKEFFNIVDMLSSKKTWIMSGNYSKVNHFIWERCDTIIWMDYSLLRCLYQGIKRSLKRYIGKQPCCGNNYESFRRTFLSRNSIILWILSTYKRRKKSYKQAFKNKKEGKAYLMFSNPEETNKWLGNLK